MFRCMTENPWSLDVQELMKRLAAVIPGFLGMVSVWSQANRGGILGGVVLFGCCDAHVFGERRPMFVCAEQMLSEPGTGVEDDVTLRVVRAFASAVLGRFDAAEQDLAWLDAHDRERIPDALFLMLRAWQPGLEWGEKDVVPEGAGVWWRGQVERHAAAFGDRALLFSGLGAVWFRDWVGAEHLASGGQLSLGTRATLALNGWLMGVPDCAVRWWRMPVVANNLSAGDHFYVLCARALFDKADPAILSELAVIDATMAGHFAASTPSHHRCFWRAVAHRCLGDEIGAAKWWLEAEAQDPLAVHRSGKFAMQAAAGAVRDSGASGQHAAACGLP